MRKIIITIPNDEDLHEQDKVELCKMFKLICDNIGTNGLSCEIENPSTNKSSNNDLNFENKQGVKLRLADKCHFCNKSADMNIGICYDCESKTIKLTDEKLKKICDALFMLRVNAKSTIEFKDEIQDIQMEIEKYLGIKELYGI